VQSIAVVAVEMIRGAVVRHEDVLITVVIEIGHGQSDGGHPSAMVRAA
jgi:hypothetical protein